MCSSDLSYGLGTIFMPASDANRFPDLRAVPLQPEIVWPIFLATGGQAQIAPASAKLAELLLASAPQPGRRSKGKSP